MVSILLAHTLYSTMDMPSYGQGMTEVKNDLYETLYAVLIEAARTKSWKRSVLIGLSDIIANVGWQVSDKRVQGYFLPRIISPGWWLETIVETGPGLVGSPIPEVKPKIDASQVNSYNTINEPLTGALLYSLGALLLTGKKDRAFIKDFFTSFVILEAATGLGTITAKKLNA